LPIFERILRAITYSVAIFLAEGLFIQIISVNYHSIAYVDRLRVSDWHISVLQALSSVRKSDLKKPGLQIGSPINSGPSTRSSTPEAIKKQTRAADHKVREVKAILENSDFLPFEKEAQARKFAKDGNPWNILQQYD